MKSTLRKTSEIIKKYNIKANKRYGQNFLIDDNILEKLSELVNKKLPIKLVNFKITESENFKKLEDNWMLRSGNLDLSDEVQQLIIEEKIMNIEIEKIREF